MSNILNCNFGIKKIGTLGNGENPQQNQPQNMLKHAPIKHICSCCFIEFRSRKGLELHNEKACRIIHMTKTEKRAAEDLYNDKLPTNRELYMAVKFLTERVYELEAQIQTLRGEGKSKRKISDVLHYLNTNHIPNSTYVEWLGDLKIKRHHLEIVFELSLTEGIIGVLREYPVLPIKIFPNGRKIYIYSHITEDDAPTRTRPSVPAPAFGGGAMWFDNMKEEDFHKFIDILIVRFTREFYMWKKENKERIENDEYYEELEIKYTSKLFPSQYALKNIYRNIRNWLGEQFAPL